jgi:hypothetical protein
VTPDRLRRRPLRADPSRRYSAQRWAERLVAALDPAARQAFATDPQGAVAEHFGRRLRPEPHLGDRRGAGGWCDGMSFDDHGVIVYAPTWSRRENFTIAHEVGHGMVDADEDEDTWNWVGDHPEKDGIIEKTCDAIASRLLLPRDRISAVLSEQRASGGAVLRLYDHFEASREACAIAVAERLGCEGFVLLAKADTELITFASRFGDTRPSPWRDDPLPPAHPLHRLDAGEEQVIESWWPTRGNDRRPFYQHAIRHEDWIYAAFAENDLWGAARFHAPRPEPTTSRRFYVNCACGYKGYTNSFPCGTCRTVPCPTCGCECDRKAKLPEEACRNCFTVVRQHLLVDGLCPRCV